VELRLVDAPATEVTEIIVTITRVEAHMSGGQGWLLLSDKQVTVDLLKLQNGAYQSLGMTNLPQGVVTQFRLYVDASADNHVTTPDGAHHPLTVPSGEQSGIKVRPASSPAAPSYVSLDSDVEVNLHPSERSHDEWILAPSSA
jgi:hypothetical protein